jgi:hypothetical protein
MIDYTPLSGNFLVLGIFLPFICAAVLISWELNLEAG